MKGMFISLNINPEDGHAQHWVRLIMDEVTLALASGTRDYIPYTAYVTADHLGNIQLVRPNEMSRFMDKADVEKELGRDIYLDFDKLACNINLP